MLHLWCYRYFVLYRDHANDIAHRALHKHSQRTIPPDFLVFSIAPSRWIVVCLAMLLHRSGGCYSTCWAFVGVSKILLLLLPEFIVDGFLFAFSFSLFLSLSRFSSSVLVFHCFYIAISLALFYLYFYDYLHSNCTSMPSSIWRTSSLIVLS